MSKTNPARGMRDFLPADVRKRNYVIGIIKEVYESYGFEPLETPAVENLETLMGKYGEEGNQLIFTIMKRGEKLIESLVKLVSESGLKGSNGGGPEISFGTMRVDDLVDLAMRYDLTVPLARVVANNKNDLPKFFKRYQIQPVWRADRPARGRFREFYQCDVDAIGSTSVAVEAEMIAAFTQILRRLGFDDFTIRLNHRQLLTDVLDTAGVPAELHTDALVAIDKLDKIGTEGVRGELQQRGISESAAETLLQIFEQTQKIIGEGKDVNRTIVANLLNIVSQEVLADIGKIIQFTDGCPVQLDPSLARGLSYYTGAIMEINVPDLAGSLGGGGRYDGLIGMFGKEQIPACGFSLGLERILVVMDERGMFPPEIAKSPPADVLVTVLDEESVPYSLKHAAALREEGLRTLLYPEPKDKLAKQIKYADLLNIPQIAIAGPNERAKNIINIKDLSLGEQSEVTPPDNWVEPQLSSARERRVRELELFHEFSVLSDLPIKLDSVIEEKFPKPDFSCIVGDEKFYFELKLLSNPKNARNVMRDSLARAFFTPDGKANLVFCFTFHSALYSYEDYRDFAQVSDFFSFSYWSGIFAYQRLRKDVVELVSPLSM